MCLELFVSLPVEQYTPGKVFHRLLVLCGELCHMHHFATAHLSYLGVGEYVRLPCVHESAVAESVGLLLRTRIFVAVSELMYHVRQHRHVHGGQQSPFSAVLVVVLRIAVVGPWQHVPLALTGFTYPPVVVAPAHHSEVAAH